jgi:hypothetical protein
MPELPPNARARKANVRLRLGASGRGGFHAPSREQLGVASGYVAAAALYVLIGVLVTDFLLSWIVGAAYLLVVAWLVPVGVRRLL